MMLHNLPQLCGYYSRYLKFEEAAYPMILDKIALCLAIIGGLNWGSIGLFRFDIVAALFGGQTSMVSRIIYALVGLAALWCISLLFRDTHKSE